ncbi:MAG TPA: PfkB family carbohydrate kinase, partial [Aggregatilineales bacterium]|nr:PfkB family carbohydrate kinase [Aggregatilineales bacterium]
EASSTVISAYGSDYPRNWLPNSFLIPRNPTTDRTLVFENRYDSDGTRTQRVEHNLTAVLPDPREITGLAWAGTNAVIVCPILDNIDVDRIKSLRELAPQAVFMLLPQGYFRQISPTGVVTPQDWETALSVVPLFDAVILSELDGPHIHSSARVWSEHTDGFIVVTEAADGSTVYQRNRVTRVPAVPIEQEIHPTGAGDVFSAALLYNYLETRDVMKAVTFASAVAARHVSGIDVTVDKKLSS